MKTWVYGWIVYPVLFSLATIWGFFSKKVRDTLRLRSWKNFLSLRFNAGKPIRYWVHVASAGELEYAIPILKELEKRQQQVLVTYYSISAKTAVERLPATLKNVSLVVPLPHDGLGLMEEFVAMLHKQGVRYLFLLKYELWPGLLWECNRLGIKVYLVDALRPGWFHRRLIHKLSGILSGYESEVEFVAHPCVRVFGDTRVERVLERAKNELSGPNQKMISAIESLFKNAKRRLFVCGSVWPADADVILPALRTFGQEHPNLQANVLWVPHELDEAFIKDSIKRFSEAGFVVISIDSDNSEFCDLVSKNVDRPIALVLGVKGILADLYRLGSLAYVGGGFGKGVHSVWEPALMHCHVCCGPATERSPESHELESVGLLNRASNTNEVLTWLKGELSSDLKRADSIERLVSRHLGAAARIIDFCETQRF